MLVQSFTQICSAGMPRLNQKHNRTYVLKNKLVLASARVFARHSALCYSRLFTYYKHAELHSKLISSYSTARGRGWVSNIYLYKLSHFEY